MRVALITLKKELISYFFNPVAYVIAVLFYLFRGWEIYARLSGLVAFGADRDLFSTTYIFCHSTNFMVVMVPPILTMRCFAEEWRTGSLEMLMTAPVRDGEVVVGKWLAALVFFAVLWLPTLLVLWLLTTDVFMAQSLALGPVLSGYLGLFLLGALLLAAGCFASSYTDNLLLAALSSMLFGSVLLAGPLLLQPMIEGLDPGSWLVTLHRQINVFEHLQNWFSRGLVGTGHIAFYLAGTAFFLFLTVRSLESRRWR